LGVRRQGLAKPPDERIVDRGPARRAVLSRRLGEPVQGTGRRLARGAGTEAFVLDVRQYRRAPIRGRRGRREGTYPAGPGVRLRCREGAEARALVESLGSHAVLHVVAGANHGYEMPAQVETAVVETTRLFQRRLGMTN
jgi:hypothetical protein